MDSELKSSGFTTQGIFRSAELLQMLFCSEVPPSGDVKEPGAVFQRNDVNPSGLVGSSAVDCQPDRSRSTTPDLLSPALMDSLISELACSDEEDSEAECPEVWPSPCAPAMSPEPGGEELHSTCIPDLLLDSPEQPALTPVPPEPGLDGSVSPILKPVTGTSITKIYTTKIYTATSESKVDSVSSEPGADLVNPESPSYDIPKLVEPLSSACSSPELIILEAGDDSVSPHGSSALLTRVYLSVPNHTPPP
jgi:hypothetical protein